MLFFYLTGLVLAVGVTVWVCRYWFTQRLGTLVAQNQVLQRTQAAVDRAADLMIWIGPAGELRYANEAACRMLGYSRQALLDCTVYDIDPHFSAQTGLAEGADLTQLGPITFETEFTTRTGETYPVEVTLSALTFDGQPYQFALARNIALRKEAVEEVHRLNAALAQRVVRRTTQLAEANRELGASASRFENLVQNITDVIAVLTAEGTLTYISPSVHALLGWTPEEVLGQNAFGFLHPDDLDEAASQFQNILKIPGRAVSVRHRFRTPAGQWVPLDTIANNLLHDPSVQGIVMVARDDTERVQYEDGLIAARQEAEELARAKSSFLTSISHDLRTPLMNIIGYSEVMTEELTAQQAEHAARILRNAEFLQTTLESALDLARLEAGRFDMLYTSFDLTTEVAGCIALLRPMADKKNLPLILQAPAEPILGRWSRSAVVRIVNNLISNAIRFTETGEITLTLAVETDAVTLAVTDTGCGIAAPFLPRIFEDFQRGAPNVQPQGSGLGLAISKRLVDLMKGTISVESTLGAGSTFTVRLPRRPQAA